MSKKIECRLPDDLYQDLKEYASKGGMTVTGIVIAGINSQIHGLLEEAKIQPCQSMPAPDIVDSGASDSVVMPGKQPDITIDTIYEPDPVKPVKAPKASSKVTPIVKALLSSIKSRPTVSHHPQCSCGVCKVVE